MNNVLRTFPTRKHDTVVTVYPSQVSLTGAVVCRRAAPRIEACAAIQLDGVNQLPMALLESVGQ